MRIIISGFDINLDTGLDTNLSHQVSGKNLKAILEMLYHLIFPFHPESYHKSKMLHWEDSGDLQGP